MKTTKPEHQTFKQRLAEFAKKKKSDRTGADLWKLLGASIETRVAGIDSSAARLLACWNSDMMKAEVRAKGRTFEGRITAARWAIRHARLCAQVFLVPAPASLIDLLAELLGVSAPPRNQPHKKQQRSKAAQYLAAGMTERQAAKRAGVARASIQRWKKTPDFQRALQVYAACFEAANARG